MSFNHADFSVSNKIPGNSVQSFGYENKSDMRDETNVHSNVFVHATHDAVEMDCGGQLTASATGLRTQRGGETTAVLAESNLASCRYYMGALVHLVAGGRSRAPNNFFTKTSYGFYYKRHSFKLILNS